METTPEKLTTPPEPERPHGGDFSPSHCSEFSSALRLAEEIHEAALIQNAKSISSRAEKIQAALRKAVVMEKALIGIAGLPSCLWDETTAATFARAAEEALNFPNS